jgi:plastocyanin
MKSIFFSRKTAFRIVSLSTLLMAVLLGGCAPAGPSDSGDADATVRMQGIAFVPPEVTITQGQTVRWVNNDFVFHTTTSGNPGDADAGSLWDSGFMFRGGSFQRTFNEAGEFVYFCEVHPVQMRDARIIVEPTDGG